VPALGLATAAVIAFGLAMERWIYRPIQRHEGAFFTVFIAAFGMQIVVQNAVGTVFGRGFETVTVALSRAVPLASNLYVAPIAAVAIGAALVCFIGLAWFLTRTQVGTGLRALSDNPDLVRVFGLDPTRLSQVAFALGSAVVVPGAIFTAMTAGLNPAIGTHVMLVSLAATIVGGIGSVRGAACGGMLLRAGGKPRLLEARSAGAKPSRSSCCSRSSSSVHRLLRQPDDAR
jgi:branched-subunit amino acid ABC-type transport system permease component